MVSGSRRAAKRPFDVPVLRPGMSARASAKVTPLPAACGADLPLEGGGEEECGERCSECAAPASSSSWRSALRSRIPTPRRRSRRIHPRRACASARAASRASHSSSPLVCKRVEARGAVATAALTVAAQIAEAAAETAFRLRHLHMRLRQFVEEARGDRGIPQPVHAAVGGEINLRTLARARERRHAPAAALPPARRGRSHPTSADAGTGLPPSRAGTRCRIPAPWRNAAS